MEERFGCDGKKRFSSESEAQAIIKHFRRKHGKRYNRKGMIPRRAYRCDVCRGWHLTSIRKDHY